MLSNAHPMKPSLAQTRRLVACGAFAACVAVPAAADMVTFSNSEGTFVWRHYCSGGMGNRFDPTRAPADQAAADPARSLVYCIDSGGGSNQVNPTSISCGAMISISRNTQPLIVFPGTFNETRLYLATCFHTPIGSDANWQSSASAGWYSYAAGLHLSLGNLCTVGIRLNLADGPHYGFITLAPGLSQPMYEPISWGYETEPNTPVTICDIDYNADGIVNSQDFFDFLSVYFASDPRADFDHSGTLDSQDFFTFLEALFVGCS